MMEKATREQTKAHNMQLVLKSIYQTSEISRADVARLTHLTRTTVSDIVGELIEAGFVAETGLGESAGGKPPILLQVQAQARHLICVDLSAIPFAGAVVDLRGTIVQSMTALPVGSPSEPSTTCEGQEPVKGEAALEAVYALLDRLVQSVNSPVIGIGIGAPGLIDLDKGVVRRSVHLEWIDLPLRRLIEDRYHLPVHLSNDSHAAALAEYTFGELRGAQNLILVRIGEGIGAGILLSGHIHAGDGFGAGEIGHLRVVEGGRLCSCGNYGCLETVASPAAIVDHMQELVQAGKIPTAGQAGPTRINWDTVRQAFHAGDPAAIALIQEAGRYLGISIANLVSILNVRRIVISGCYAEFGDTFLDAISTEVKNRSLPTTAAETQIVHSMLGPEIVLLGVSALVLAQEMGLP